MNQPPHDGAVITFKEIGRQLGITGPGARHIYTTAIRKLRSNPRELERFQSLVEIRRREKDSRESGPVFQKDRAA